MGYGSTADWIIQYMRLPNSNRHRGWAVNTFPSATFASTARPASIWFPDVFSVLYRRDTSTPAFPIRVMDSELPRGPEVFPSFSCPDSTCMIGPPTGLPLASFDFFDGGAFALMSDRTIRQSYAPGGVWSDFPIVPAPAFSVNTSPSLVNRSLKGKGGSNSSTDSVWFGCGAASPARACETRRTKDGAPMQFTTTFGSSSSTFITGTRPTAFSNYSVNGERWVFAAVSEPGPIRAIWALKETSGIDATTQPTYTAYAIETTFMNSFQGTYSTPMPYVRKDGKVAVVYYRTTATDTEVWQAIWSGTAWSTSRIHDVGFVIPPNNEPVAYTTSGSNQTADQTNAVFVRLPSSATEMRDTIELIEQPDGQYAKSLLPQAFEKSNLYVIQGSKLLQVDEAATNTRTQIGAVDFTGAAPFATDGVGLGYLVQNGSLWEVNLNDGVRRQLGTEAWGATTHLVFGWESSNTEIPRLWAIYADTLYKVSLADGHSIPLSNGWVGAQAMAYKVDSSSAADDLFIVAADKGLYRVNSDTGAKVLMGTKGTWPHTRGITYTKTGKLFIADGTDDSHMRVYLTDPLTGQPGISSTQFSNVQGMASINGEAYLMKSQQIYRLSVGNSSLGIVSSGTANWGYTVTGMIGRDL
jgi:hypothetical protein